MTDNEALNTLMSFAQGFEHLRSILETANTAQTRIDQAQASVDALTKQKAALEADVAAAQTKLTADAQAAEAALAERLRGIQDRIAAAEAKLADITNKATVAEAQHAATVTGLQARAATLRADLDSLTAQKSIAAAALDKAQQDFASFKAKLG